MSHDTDKFCGYTELIQENKDLRRQLAEKDKEIERLKFYERYAEYADAELQAGRRPAEPFGFNIKELAEKEEKGVNP